MSEYSICEGEKGYPLFTLVHNHEECSSPPMGYTVQLRPTRRVTRNTDPRRRRNRTIRNGHSVHRRTVESMSRRWQANLGLWSGGGGHKSSVTHHTSDRRMCRSVSLCNG